MAGIGVLVDGARVGAGTSRGTLVCVAFGITVGMREAMAILTGALVRISTVAVGAKETTTLGAAFGVTAYKTSHAIALHAIHIQKRMPVLAYTHLTKLLPAFFNTLAALWIVSGFFSTLFACASYWLCKLAKTPLYWNSDNHS